MSVKGRVVQINISPGGVPKLPVAAARVTPDGLEGDGHRDLEHHGGPESGPSVSSRSSRFAPFRPRAIG